MPRPSIADLSSLLEAMIEDVRTNVAGSMERGMAIEKMRDAVLWLGKCRQAVVDYDPADIRVSVDCTVIKPMHHIMDLDPEEGGSDV